MLKNTPERYGSIHKAFHWLMAIAIIGMLALGLWMEDLEPTPEKYQWYGIHKSIGILLIAAVVLRYGWRLINVIPALPAELPNHEKFGAKAGHFLLYLLMLALPLSGWVMSSAGGHPVDVFGIPIPAIVEKNKELGSLARDAHGFLAYAIIFLASIHAIAALRHHFIRKDNVLKRMLPFS